MTEYIEQTNEMQSVSNKAHIVHSAVGNVSSTYLIAAAHGMKALMLCYGASSCGEQLC